MRPNLWIFSLLLLLAPVTALAQHTVLVKAESLTLREKPSRTSKALDKLTNLQPVDLLKQEGDWAEVRTVKTAKPQTGYVLATYLTGNAFVYTGDEKINGRFGPSTQYDVIIEYTLPNMPLRVLDTAGNGWLMVMDYEGDRSWIFGKGIKTSGRYVIAALEKCNVRKGVGIGQDMAFIAPKGYIMQVLEEKEGWLHVKCTDGDEGWLSAKLVFGWNDVPAPAGSTRSEGGKKSSSSSEAAKEDSKSSKSDKDSEEKTASTRRSRRSRGSSGDDEDSGSGKSSTRRSKRSSRSSDDSDNSSGKSSVKSSSRKSSSSDDSDSDNSSSKSSVKSSSRKSSSSNDSDSEEKPATRTRRTRTTHKPAASDE